MTKTEIWARYDAKRRRYRAYSRALNRQNDVFSKWREGYLERICAKWSEKATHAAWDYRVRKSVVDGGHLLSGVSNVIE